MLFRWFIGLSMDDGVWVPTVFSKNRDRLIKHEAVTINQRPILSTSQRPIVSTFSVC